MKIWTLYCHTHIKSGRRYIGLTSQTMEKRWVRHVYAAIRFAKGGRWHFPNAIRKYGSDAFSHEALCQSWTLEGANTTEEELIRQYDTQNPEKGFNLVKGGAHVPHHLRKNPWDDPKYRFKVTESIRLIANSPNGIRLRASNGSKSKGRHPTVETRMKIGESSRSEHRLNLFQQNRCKDPPSDLARFRSAEAHKKKHQEWLQNPSCRIHGRLLPGDFYTSYSERARDRKRVICKLCAKARAKNAYLKKRK